MTLPEERVRLMAAALAQARALETTTLYATGRTRPTSRTATPRGSSPARSVAALPRP